MSADILRRAASLMRKRAEGAACDNPEPWSFIALHEEGCCGEVDSANGWMFSSERGLAEHVAHWCPTAAESVAELLEKCARDLSHLSDFGRGAAIVQRYAALAEAIAQSYLGDANVL